MKIVITVESLRDGFLISSEGRSVEEPAFMPDATSVFSEIADRICREGVAESRGSGFFSSDRTDG